MLEELLHHFFTELSLHVPQELESLFVGDFRERVIGVVSLEDGVETSVRVGASVLVIEAKVVHGAPKRSVSKLSFHQGEVFTVEFSTNVTFDKDGEAFVEPEVFPVASGDGVSSPGVGHLVSRDIDLRFITNDNSGRSESQEGVLHTSHGEGGRQNKDRVVTPNVGSQICFSLVQIISHFREFFSAFGHLGRLSVNSSTRTSGLVDNVTSSNGHQVVRDGDFTEEVSLLNFVIDHVLFSLVGTHLHHKLLFSFNSSGVGHFVGGSVLDGGDGPAVDIFALRVHVRHNLSSSLGLGHPGHGVGVSASLIVNHNGDSLASSQFFLQLDDKRLSHVVDSDGIENLPGLHW